MPMPLPDEAHEDDELPKEPIYYSIEQVATQSQLTKRTLRYYEEMGLLPQAVRTEGNYRRYTEDDLQRVEYIKALRDLLGFSLTDIRDFLRAEDEREQTRMAYRQDTDVESKIAHLAHSDELIQGQLQLIEQKMTGLQKMQHDLLSKLEKHAETRKRLRQQVDSNSTL